MNVTIEQQIAAAAREIALRRNVYPGFVARGKMTQEKASAEITAMEAVIETLKATKAEPTSAAALIAQYRAALEQCVRVVKVWHGDDDFDLYFNHSPEMKLIRDVLGTMSEPV